MPTYCYRDADGEIWEKVFLAGEAPERIMITECYRSWFAERDRQAEFVTQTISVRGGSGHVQRTWPLECIGSGVNAAQAGELRTHLRKSGVPTEVSADGNPIYTSAAHRRKALKIRNFVDKSSYY